MKQATITEIKSKRNISNKQTANLSSLQKMDSAIAALNVTIDPDDLERLLLAQNPKFNQILERSRQSIKEEGGLKPDEFWQLVDERSGVEDRIRGIFSKKSVTSNSIARR